MGDIILRLCIIAFGICNLIIWKLLKYDFILVKAKVIESEYLPGRRYGYRNFKVEYIINNKKYRTTVDARKDVPIYDGEIRK